MNVLVRSLVICILPFLLIACSGAANPFLIPIPSQTATPAQGRAAPPTSLGDLTDTSPRPAHPDGDRLSPALTMNSVRAAHSATLLADGRVLIAGGFVEQGTSEVAIATAEIYDPRANTFEPTADMTEPRDGHTATLLANGQVLLVGGWGRSGRMATAERYDPTTGTFHRSASMGAPRQGMTATLLPSGTVLIAGGDSARDTPQIVAELYDPATDTFRPSGSLNGGRSAHTATLLDDGRVLLAGGTAGGDRVLASTEIYDPGTGKFTLTGSMNVPRYKHAALRLHDGRVLVVGGSDQNDWRGQYSSAEIYAAGSGTFTRSADLNRARFKLADAVALLADGTVLVAGGNRQIELFDDQTHRFVMGETLDTDYYYSVATRLTDGRVLISGGYDASIRPSDKAWIYE